MSKVNETDLLFLSSQPPPFLHSILHIDLLGRVGIHVNVLHRVSQNPDPLNFLLAINDSMSKGETTKVSFR
jgi:hypothetical protein